MTAVSPPATPTEAMLGGMEMVDVTYRVRDLQGQGRNNAAGKAVAALRNNSAAEAMLGGMEMVDVRTAT